MSKILIVLLSFCYTDCAKVCHHIMNFFFPLDYFIVIVTLYNIQMFIIHQFYLKTFNRKKFLQCHNKGKSSSYDSVFIFQTNAHTHRNAYEKTEYPEVTRSSLRFLFVCIQKLHFDKSFDFLLCSKRLW